MSHTFKPLPQHKSEPDVGLGRILLWFFLFGFAVIPRVCILAFWIFSYLLGDAYSHWIVPAIGFFVLPCTTLMYAVMWSIDSNGVNGWEWIVVGIAFVADAGFWAAARASLR